jgi:hypothetical protein
MTGYNDFFMLLSPSDKVKAMVRNFKIDASDLIGMYDSIGSIAHISIMKKHRQRSFLTHPEITEFRKRLCLIPPVTLNINGFDHFNHGNEYRTIYARINQSPETTHWFKMLKQHLKIKEFMVPNITICRNIPVADFEKLWPHFKTLEFNDTFTVNHLTILQRETFASFATWQPYMQLPFEARAAYNMDPQKPSLLKPVQNLQTSLF